MTSRTYCAIIGDITRSRELPDRAAVQRKFLRTIDRINAEFSRSIAAGFRFRVSEGDAFEGLLDHPAESYRIVRFLREQMGPVPFLVGIGVGTLSTPLGKNVDAVDGEAFHRARRALEHARSRRQAIVFDLDSPSLPLLNALVGLMEAVRVTPRQREVLRWMGALGTQAAVARKLKISQPAVSKVMTVPAIAKLVGAENAVADLLRDPFPRE
jgi:hypothetical protein